uniref:Nuclear receptor domain-containing protein n=1 Tax=Caenorhabditis tropicalis TaxID=1561998 RepID=A0A1I7US31_9PELO
MEATGMLFYPHGLMFGAYCIQCCMGIPHFFCFPTIPADLVVTKAQLKAMSDKLEEHNNNNGQQQWAPFQPSFNGRPSEPPHPFNYEQQHRERPPVEFNNDINNSQQTNQQQPAPFMQHWFPRIGLQFSDFSDYQRFNGFQRNAFFPNPFAPQFANPAYSFPINPAMHNPMASMDHFNLPHGQQQFSQNLDTSETKKETSQQPIPEDDKPPVLSVEYCLKPDSEMKYNSNREFSVPSKEEVVEESKRNKKEFSFPPPLSAEKPFEQARIRDDTLTFNPPFYRSPEMPANPTFKQEMTTVIKDQFLEIHRRTISDDKRYVCKRNQRCNNASRDGTGYRKICRSCRMKRCLEIGMLPENVQHKRNRRDSGSPHTKTPFDTFFNGFYPGFPPAVPNVVPASLQAEICPSSS